MHGSWILLDFFSKVDIPGHMYVNFTCFWTVALKIVSVILWWKFVLYTGNKYFLCEQPQYDYLHHSHWLWKTMCSISTILSYSLSSSVKLVFLKLMNLLLLNSTLLSLTSRASPGLLILTLIIKLLSPHAKNAHNIA